MSTTEAPVKPDLASITEAEIENFMQEWESIDHIKCEYGHNTEVSCTYTVTHRAADCKYGLRICTSAAQDVMKRRKDTVKCVYCKRPATECWRVYPI